MKAAARRRLGLPWPVRRGHHDKVLTQTGVDGRVTVSCECGQRWLLSKDAEMSDGMAVALRHHETPNVGDPRKSAARDLVPDEENNPTWRSSWVEQHARKAP